MKSKNFYGNKIAIGQKLLKICHKRELGNKVVLSDVNLCIT